MRYGSVCFDCEYFDSRYQQVDNDNKGDKNENEIAF